MYTLKSLIKILLVSFLIVGCQSSSNEIVGNSSKPLGIEFKENEFKLIAELIYKVIKGLSENRSDNSRIENEVKKEIIDLCSSFPIYGN